ncbi:putative flagellar biosynthesis protein [Candidatus Termititenax persephonae]|uniref:Flagellar biosynthesis protein n=1 Tax=Candidatus Termititenax persephonae TaxID=2218525 RepID=A0A388TGF2_9BACT|nr:putative flagellar biosynthesis protein [Candidatus Termititenax persephonae]
MPSRRELEEKEAQHRRKIKRSTLELDSQDKSTRSAIAIRYDAEQDAAPVILAAGRGDFAEDILKIAEDHKIPFYEDKGLADLLLKLEVSTEVPQEMYALIAEVLAFIFRLDQMAAKREKFYKRVKELDNVEK